MGLRLQAEMLKTENYLTPILKKLQVLAATVRILNINLTWHVEFIEQ
jgi:hypothetical protein